MFGLVDYHVVTDTISLGSIPGEGVGRSGALPGISSGSSPIPHGSWTTQYMHDSQTEGVMVRPPIQAIQSSGL